jgi:hypothetical protein
MIFWLCSMDQTFYGNDEKTQESRFWDLVQCPQPTAIIQPKSRNSNARHDGILSIGSFRLIANNHYALKTLFLWHHGFSYLFLVSKMYLTYNKEKFFLKSVKPVIFVKSVESVHEINTSFIFHIVVSKRKVLFFGISRYYLKISALKAVSMHCCFIIH